MAVLLQAGVSAFNGLVVYHFHWRRGTSIVGFYGYPVWAVGTFLIILGISICAHVVEASTFEWVLELKSDNQGNTPEFRIVRLQKSMPDQHLPAFAIYNARNDTCVRLSIRDLFPAGSFDEDSTAKFEQTSFEMRMHTISRGKFLSLLTLLGSITTLTGFIMQNVGTRELHWSAGVSQLIATVILVAIRGWLRRYIGNRQAKPTRVLDPGFEPCDLTSDVHQVEHLGLFLENCQSGLTRPATHRESPIFLREKVELELTHHAAELHSDLWRVLQSHSLLWNIQPGSNGIDVMTKQACESIDALLRLLKIQDSVVTWHQRVEVSFPRDRTTRDGPSQRYLVDVTLANFGLFLIERLRAGHS